MKKLEVSIEKLFEANAHLGHQASRWNPKMAKFVYGTENGIHLFDLAKTVTALEEAVAMIKKQISEGKKIVFVSTKKQFEGQVVAMAKGLGQYFVQERWLGGTLTNFNQIKRSIDKLAEMKKTKADSGYMHFTKKERVLLDREMTRLERVVGGLTGLSAVPDTMFIFNLKDNKGAAMEAKRSGVYTIGICDSNADPDSVDLAIPMSDDSADAIQYILSLLTASEQPSSPTRSGIHTNDEATPSGKTTGSRVPPIRRAGKHGMTTKKTVKKTVK
ncbi:30S ribosomal protein S2 [Candidatus Woesebacteria bacterium RIFOXYA1_FULL_43_9]|uniref:Small ribosomal subunit protein uS2 n=1 Tax=Candidatus Woesebacteria bacterium RIFOXYA1_FULL_43_9 TaxID=1802534 RepID=A0A1F8CM08_9BACT|nr:MAG: 30S ribosomal protein S2 [Candidatus Woesebacteria bacterium RIFOXYA1_FULL_43_9]